MSEITSDLPEEIYKRLLDAFRKENVNFIMMAESDKGKTVMDYLTNREIGLVINIPGEDGRSQDIDYQIRRKAVEFGIPVITNLELAKTVSEIIERQNGKAVESYEFAK